MKFNKANLLSHALKYYVIIVGALLNSYCFIYAQPNALDPTFVNGTFTTTGTSAMTIYGSAIQPDVKIIVVGEFTHYNGIARNRIVRINVNS